MNTYYQDSGNSINTSQLHSKYNDQYDNKETTSSFFKSLLNYATTEETPTPENTIVSYLI